MGEDPPPLPTRRYEPLLRGPLILTAISRVLMVPFFLLCAVAASNDLKIFYHRLTHYHNWYIVDKIAMAVSMWTFLLLHVLLAWLFFTRRRMFRSLMIYVSLLPLVYLAGTVFHMSHFKNPPPSHTGSQVDDAWIGYGVFSAMVIWPIYYGFSPRLKRVFTR